MPQQDARVYKTGEVAEALGIKRGTLLTWLRRDRLPESLTPFYYPGGRVRFWTQNQVDELRKLIRGPVEVILRMEGGRVVSSVVPSGVRVHIITEAGNVFIGEVAGI